MKVIGYWFVVIGLISSISFGAEKPNILMLCIDDMNDWTGFLGGHPQAKTPNMDKLAARGVNFINAYCAAPGCSPSRNAILFGIEPHNSGLYPFYNINHIEPGVLDKYTPLPKLYKDNGYTTCGLTKVWHNPDNTYRQDEQWDEYHYYGNAKLHLLKDKGYVPEKKRLVACPADNPLEDFQDYKSAMHAVRFLKKNHDKPFFLAVGFIKPHTPFIPPLENWERFSEPITPPPIKADDLTDIPLAGQANAQIYVEIRVRQDHAWEMVRHGYLACINFTDDNVGRVLDALAKSPYADNTIVMLWSDHGFHLGEKRSFSKFSLWNEATRTPFIIYDPRGRGGNGKTCAEPTGLINVYRTLCDLTGLKVPDYVDGQALTPWLDHPAKEKTTPAMTTWGRGNYSLRTKKWRYTRYFDGSEELYNESEDSNEWTNLAGNPEYDSLKKKFAGYLPKHEAPQVTSGRELYNVADADAPRRNIKAYQRDVKKYKELGLQPPLD